MRIRQIAVAGLASLALLSLSPRPSKASSGTGPQDCATSPEYFSDCVSMPKHSQLPAKESRSPKEDLLAGVLSLGVSEIPDLPAAPAVTGKPVAAAPRNSSQAAAR